MSEEVRFPPAPRARAKARPKGPAPTPPTVAVCPLGHRFMAEEARRLVARVNEYRGLRRVADAA